MKEITLETRCVCGDTFEEHAGHHDNSIGGDGSWVDLGCTRCGCAQFEPADE